MTELVIGARGSDGLRLRPLGWCHPEADDYDDGNWLQTSVDLSVTGLKARVTADLGVDEFLSFRRGLWDINEACRGTASYESLEPWLQLSIEVGHRGELRVRGEVRTGPTFGNSLRFALADLDLSYVTPMIAQVDEILEAFPLKGLHGRRT
jgi:hypothetical protein